jgi:hypothetical protein
MTGLIGYEPVAALIAAARRVAYGYHEEVPDQLFEVDYNEMMALRAALKPFEEGGIR